MTSRSILAGRVYVDENMNAFNDGGEPGVEGVRIYMEDGSFVLTDQDGHYHFEGITPGSHVVQLDTDSLDETYEAVQLPNSRFAGRDFSQFVDLKASQVWRANFRLLKRPATASQTDAPVATPAAKTKRTEKLHLARRVSLHLNFSTSKAILPESEIIKMNALIEDLKHLQIEKMVLIGHTDNRPVLRPQTKGIYKNNQELSEARAAYIAEYLRRALGLKASVLQVEGHGKREPITSNDTATGRKLNRRVQVLVYGEEIQTVTTTDTVRNSPKAEDENTSSKENIQVKHASSTTTREEAVGILSPAEGTHLMNAVSTVRVRMDSKLTPKLTLDGKEISSDRIGFKFVDPKSGMTLYSYIGVNFGKVGEHQLALKGLDPFGNARIDKSITITRTGEIASIRLLEEGENIADGQTPVRIRLKIMDSFGKQIRGNMKLELRGGDLFKPDSVREIDPNVRDPEHEASVIQVNRDGWAEFSPTTVSGTHQVILGYNDTQRTMEIFVKPEMRDWIMVGIGEGTMGYNKLKGALQSISERSKRDGYYSDGRLAFYSKGRVPGDLLLTMSYDTAKTQGQVGNSLHQTIDPNTYYTVYGDGSQQKYDAASQAKLYLKLERNQFYAMFGDFNTGLSITELSSYSRSLNGIKSEYHGNTFGYNAFAAQTSQTLAKDEIRGDGTSGLYRLNRSNIVVNAEKITIETRDRFKNEVILEKRILTRHLDYDIDYTAGTLFFKQPIMSKDTELNPIFIVAEYESDDQHDKFTTFGGRGSVKALDGNLEAGVSYVQQGQLGPDDKLTGADATYQLTEQTELRAEAAQTETETAGRNRAYKAEVIHSGETLRARGYFRQQDDAFGLGQAQGSENATRKYGVDGDLQVSEKSKIRYEAYRQQQLATRARRDAASLQGEYDFGRVSTRLGTRLASDIDGTGNKLTSKQLTAGATAHITDRLSARVNREQNLGSGQNSVDFPTRTSVGADYRLFESTVVSATQEWTQGDQQDSQSTRLGIRTTPWEGAQLATSYEQQLGEDGTRSFANVGLKQTWNLTQAWSVDAGLDRTQTLKHPGALALNSNSPLASGGDDDFTALSFGSSYRPGDWIWNNRAEYRLADLSRKWSVLTSLQGDPLEALTTSVSLQWLNNQQISAGSKDTQATANLGLAWRPDYDGLLFFDRLEIEFSDLHSPGSSSKSWRYINNFDANWQLNSSTQIALHYGAKWVRENLDNQSYTGYTDLLSLQARYDITNRWDIGLQGGALRSGRQLLPNAGLSVGYNLIDNMWVSLGYNFLGFYDKDFAAAEYSRQGMFMRFRFKFDQNSLPNLLKENR
ncbi:MAG: OmpA family protein [Mariprofundaceae bacterium]